MLHLSLSLSHFSKMRRRRILTLLTLLLLSALVFTSFYHHITIDFTSNGVPVTVSSINHPTYLAQHFSIKTQPFSSQAMTESILFPDWDVFVLLPPNLNLTPSDHNHISCLFSNGATSVANYTNKISSSNRQGFLCKLPRSVQRLRPFYSPRLIKSPSHSVAIVIGVDRATEMMRWTKLAYESYFTAHDVIVFAKGVNNGQGKDWPVADITCVFSVNGVVASITAATSSAQEVFRCPHPNNINYFLDDDVRVSVKIAGERSPIPSIASYRLLPVSAQDREEKQKALTCACTMVYNVAKFLQEWVLYHTAIGVERFVLYDNGSNDGLEAVLARLTSKGHNVSTVFWPWQKTQEAGFSHCAAAQANGCTWMAFFDIDEFLYSSSWAEASRPNKSMVRLMLGANGGPSRIGQMQITCVDFGPSGQKAYMKAGVTQGYTCRVMEDSKQQRHKSMVRLEALGHSLKNWVHHFEVGPEWETRRMKDTVVNHYKYQAWSEFKLKFRRRVSIYMADWGEKRNMGSRDRTPGPGLSGEVEPKWWAQKKCHLRDEGLRMVVRRWFSGPQGMLPWE